LGQYKRHGYAIGYLDESTFKLEPHIIKTWNKKGSRPIQKYVLNRSQKVHVFGVLFQGKTITRTAERMNSQEYILFLKQLRKKHEKLCLIIDNARWHLTKKVEAYIKVQGIKIIQLPPYSPELNPIEQYWKNIKCHLGNKILTNKVMLKKELLSALKRKWFIPKSTKY
jgi:transposase